MIIKSSLTFKYSDFN